MVARLRLRLAHVFCEEDCGPLLVSWAIALSAAIAWLLLVYVTPPAAPIVQIRPAGPAIDDGIVTVDPGAGYNAMPSIAPKGAHQPVVRRKSSTGPLDLADVFALSVVMRGVTEATRVIAGAQMVRADVGHPIGRAEKSALAPANGAATPGMTQLGAPGGPGSSSADGNLGQVQHGGAIERATFHAKPLPIVTAPPVGGAAVDATELASFVRGRAAQLQSCYELARGTDLAGVVALRITVGDAGSVRNAEIVRRTWSGAGAAETESCLLRVVKSWRLPSGSDGATITLPISFTRGS
ncbi:MAG TPA: AgmX/PglI C-terminal domain-containing protein [Gemmatimonadaceae bacterium]|nr:AgmX/PglI C-terminal domain-containing protein [Gemmatimonadaceae bacterium]